jgi:hypothetical protein
MEGSNNQGKKIAEMLTIAVLVIYFIFIFIKFLFD